MSEHQTSQSAEVSLPSQHSGVERFEALIDKHLLAFTDASRHQYDFGGVLAPEGSATHAAAVRSHLKVILFAKIAIPIYVVSLIATIVAGTHVDTGDDSSNPWLTVMMVSLVITVISGVTAIPAGFMVRSGPSLGVVVASPIAAARKDLRRAKERLLAVEAPVDVLSQVEVLVQQSERPLGVLVDASERNQMHTPQAVAARDELFAMAAEVNALIEVATVRFETIGVADKAGFPRERLLGAGADLIENTDMLRELLGDMETPALDLGTDAVE